MTRNVSENHIRPDPVNFLTKVEIWDIIMGTDETSCCSRVPEIKVVSDKKKEEIIMGYGRNINTLNQGNERKN